VFEAMFSVAHADSGVITGWNATESAFVAPRDGLYVFSISGAAQGTNSEVTLVIDGDYSDSAIYICTHWLGARNPPGK
jgi:hypothetical protein